MKEVIEAQSFIANKIMNTLNECFKLGEKPLKFSGRLPAVSVEDFRKKLAEIQSSVARRIFVLAKANHLIHLRIGEYLALVAAADPTERYGSVY